MKPAVLRRELLRDHRPRPAVGGIGLQREAVRQLGDHADIGAPPPFAVGHHVEPGALLQRHGVADGGVHGVARRSRPTAAFSISSRTYQRARHRADDRGGEQRQRPAHGCHSLSAPGPGLPGCRSRGTGRGVSAWPNATPCSIMSWNRWIRYAFWNFAASR